jgi:uncharacterized membrane protein
MLDVVHAGPSIAAAFAGSMVEAVEAMTIVLAVGTVRGWRSALTGAAAGLAVLALVVIIFGPAIARIPIGLMQIMIGSLLVLFGLRWLRKAILRSAGVIPLHDEDAAFARESHSMRSAASSAGQVWDPIAIATAFKSILLEGTEVVVIVIGVGAVGGLLVPASVGALAACVLVSAVGVLAHRPLARVPENSLKFAVGLLISAFGLFWFGEGLGVVWPYKDAAILGIAAILLIVSWLTVRLARRATRPQAILS